MIGVCDEKMMVRKIGIWGGRDGFMNVGIFYR